MSQENYYDYNHHQESQQFDYDYNITYQEPTLSPAYPFLDNDNDKHDIINSTSNSNSNSNYYDEDEDDASIWTKIAALLWIATLIFWLYAQAKHEQEQERIAAEEQALEEQDAKRRCMLEPEKRNIVIHDTIITLQMDEHDLKGLENTSATTNTNTTSTSTSTSTSTRSKQSLSVENIAECPICLERFEPGDQLSWSKDMKCHHIFHADCLKPWLLTNDECPCCRAIFFDEMDFKKRGLLKNNKKQSHGSNNHNSPTGFNMDGSSGSSHSIRAMDISGGSYSSRRNNFRIVNGLVSIVRNVRDGLSGSESSRGSYGYGNRHSITPRDEESNIGAACAGSCVAIMSTDQNDLAESDEIVNNNKNTSLEMVSMVKLKVKKSKSDNDVIEDVKDSDKNNKHDIVDQSNDLNYKKKKRRKNRGKKRYRALANDSDDDDDDESQDDDNNYYVNKSIQNENYKKSQNDESNDDDDRVENHIV